MHGTTYAVEQPYVSKPTAPLDAIFAAAGKVSREWGDYGYTMSIEATGIGAYLFGVRCSDGSEFYLLSDRYGNVSQAEWDGHEWRKVSD